MKLCETTNCRLSDGCISPCIQATGSLDPDLLVIGEAPSAEDDIQSDNFRGDGGELLRELLTETGFKLSNVAFAQVVRCRPTVEKWGKIVNREPILAEIKACKHFLFDDIERLKPKAILTLGSVALKTVLNLTGITANRGKVFSYNGISVVPTFHPSMVIRDPTNLEYLARDVEQVYSESYSDKVVEAPAVYTLIRRPQELVGLLDKAAEAHEVSFDLETSRLNPHMEDAQIVCCSFSFVERESFVVPLYHKEQIFYGKNLALAKQIIKTIMESDLPKIAHNGKFDMTWLLVAEGIVTNNFAYDTMLMQYLLTEQAGTHGLDWLAWRHTTMGGYDQELELYKSEHKEADPKRGGSYRNIPWSVLYPYAGMDTDCALRCKHVLEKLL